MMLTELADIARAAGLKTVETPGWKTRTNHDARGRPLDMLGVRTITCHHTANGGAAGNAPSLAVVLGGRPGLTGPLAHSLVGRDGTIFIIAAGHCNHAGESLDVDYTNSYAIGIEAEAVGIPGTKTDWPPVQMEAYAWWARALADHFGLSVADVRGHKETCSPVGRKSDPDFDMTAFRRRVAAVDLEDVVKQADIVAVAKATAKEVVAELLAAEVTLGPFASSVLVGRDGKPTTIQTVGNLLQWAAAHAQHADATADDIRAGLAPEKP